MGRQEGLKIPFPVGSEGSSPSSGTINNYIMRRKQQSLQRAINRGHITPDGIKLGRPFNNRKPTFGRKENELRKKDYEYYKERFNSIKGGV